MRSNYWETRQRKLSRRRFVGGAAGASAGLAALAAVGCGDDDDDAVETPAATATSGASGSPTQAAGSPTAEPKPQGKKGGVTRGISSNATYDSFDASRSRFTPVATIIGRTMQRALFWDSFKDGTLGGGFAESWEQPDPQTVVLKLRKNNFFHDKAPVNGRQTKAEDIKYHIDRNKAGKRLDGTEDPNFYRKGEYQIVDSVTVADAETIQVKLAKPSPLFLNLLAQSYEGIAAPEAIEAFEKDYSNFDQKMIIGTGPMVLVEFASEGRAKYQRFDKFTGTSYLDGIQEVPLFTDPQAAQAAFEQKQIDAYGPPNVQVLAEMRERFKGKVGEGTNFSANPIIAGSYYGGAAPWNNPNLIGAYFRGIDRRQLIQQFHGGRGAISGSIPPSQGAFGLSEKELIEFPGYLQDVDKDIAEARKMWEAGGGPALGDVTIDVPDIFEGSYQASAILTAMLNKNLGTSQFKAKVEPYSTITSKIIQQKYGSGNANLWYGWDTEVLDPEPTAFLMSNYSSTSTLNKQFDVKLDGMDDLLAKVGVELDIEKRKDMTREVERKLLKAYGGGRIYSHMQITNTLRWNYYHAAESAPFSTAHLTAMYAWIDPDDPTYQGRPS
ncbi:MAG: ABC transporter substrate-binding protein [Chloroflexi bacterium]|nr:ABC transporter substrate-binding protein [Chloroflexota bacterium]